MDRNVTVRMRYYHLLSFLLHIYYSPANYFNILFFLKEKIRHPSYSAEYKQNDIALLKLDKPVPFGDLVRPACIRTDLSDVPESVELLVSGWGRVNCSDSKISHVLQKTNLTTVPLAQCNATFMEYNKDIDMPSLRQGLLNSQLCAIDTNEAHTKQKRISSPNLGDSGGPIFIYDYETGVSTIVGVTSFGVGCGTAYPSVYTRIASFVDWIEKYVWPENENLIWRFGSNTYE